MSYALKLTAAGAEAIVIDKSAEPGHVDDDGDLREDVAPARSSSQEHQAGSSEGWQNALNAWNLVRAIQKEIAACSEAAAKTKKDERCTITVPAGPAQ